MGTTDKQKSNEDGGRGECRVHGVSLDAAAVAPPQFHLDYSLTRNEWKRKERAKEGRKEGRKDGTTQGAISQDRRAGVQPGTHSLRAQLPGQFHHERGSAKITAGK